MTLCGEAHVVSMPDSTDSAGDAYDSGRLEMDFRAAAFPSDALSIKRLRVIFPDHFDGPGRIADGYEGNDFFYSGKAEQPDHLFRLNDLICDERIVASGGFYESYSQYRLELLDAEDRESIALAKARLEENYLFFKLADSPAAARLLIQQVEEEGNEQGRTKRGRTR